MIDESVLIFVPVSVFAASLELLEVSIQLSEQTTVVEQKRPGTPLKDSVARVGPNTHTRHRNEGLWLEPLLIRTRAVPGDITLPFAEHSYEM